MPKEETIKSPTDESNESKDDHRIQDSLSDSVGNLTFLTAHGTSEKYPEELNPFKSDEENEEEYHTVVNSSTKSISKISTNPFDDDIARDEEDEDKEENVVPLPESKPPTTVLPAKRRLTAPQISLNPFSSDEEDEHESDLENKRIVVSGTVPIPKPRTITYVFFFLLLFIVVIHILE